MKYVNVYSNTRVCRCMYQFKKNLYTFLKNIYIWFKNMVSDMYACSTCDLKNMVR